MQNSTVTLALAALVALPSLAQTATATAPSAAEAPVQPAVEPMAVEAPVEPAPAPVVERTPDVATAPIATVTPRTIHERGGLFGLGFVVTPRVGGALGGLSLGGAGFTLTPSLELGYLLPLPAPVGRDLEVTLTGSYAAPFVSQTIAHGDPRLASSELTWDATVHQWSGAAGLRYRVPIDVAWLRPTAALAVQALMTRTVVTGDSAGERFPITVEDAVDVGVVGAVGADIFVGPGAVSVEVQGAWAPANHFVLQNTSSSSVGLLLGYRFFI